MKFAWKTYAVGFLCGFASSRLLSMPHLSSPSDDSTASTVHNLAIQRSEIISNQTSNDHDGQNLTIQNNEIIIIDSQSSTNDCDFQSSPSWCTSISKKFKRTYPGRFKHTSYPNISVHVNFRHNKDASPYQSTTCAAGLTCHFSDTAWNKVSHHGNVISFSYVNMQKSMVPISMESAGRSCATHVPNEKGETNAVSSLLDIV